MVTHDNVEAIFTYHSPGEQVTKYTRIRECATQLVRVILDETERGADQQAAIRKVREAVMTANASIATGNAA